MGHHDSHKPRIGGDTTVHRLTRTALIGRAACVGIRGYEQLLIDALDQIPLQLSHRTGHLIPIDLALILREVFQVQPPSDLPYDILSPIQVCDEL